MHGSLPFTLSLHCRAPRHSCEVALAHSPLAYLPTHGGSSTSPVTSCQAVQAWRVRGRTHSSPGPALLSPEYRVQNTRDRASTPAPSRPVHAGDLRALRSLRTPPSAPKPAHPPFPRLCAHPPTLARVSHRFSAAAQLVLYRTLEHYATRPSKSRRMRGEPRSQSQELRISYGT